MTYAEVHERLLAVLDQLVEGPYKIHPLLERIGIPFLKILPLIDTSTRHDVGLVEDAIDASFMTTPTTPIVGGAVFDVGVQLIAYTNHRARVAVVFDEVEYLVVRKPESSRFGLFQIRLWRPEVVVAEVIPELLLFIGWGR
jgi:hypothetical protein